MHGLSQGGKAGLGYQEARTKKARRRTVPVRRPELSLAFGDCAV
jgi:hypothetical protein